MFDLDKWQEIWSTIARNKLRTFLTALGVFWGIMMLVLLLGSGHGLENGVKYTFQGFAVNSVYVWPQKTTLAYDGFPPGRYYGFENADIDAIRNNVPEVDALAPRIQLGGWRDGNNVTRGTKAGSFQVMGDYPEFNQIQIVKIVRGRFLNDLDMKEKRKVCVIGDEVQRELYEEGEKVIGSYIKIQGVYFLVVGLFNTVKNRGGEADRDARTIYIPFTTFQHAFNYINQLGWFSMTADPGIPAPVVEQKVRSLLMSRHEISPKDEHAVGSFNAEKEAQKYMGLFTGINAFIWLVGLGTLLAGVIGISNIMLIIVNDRTKEIGIRKALGAAPWSIVSMVIQESVVLTTFAGYSGLVLGVAALEGLNYMMGEGAAFFRNPSIDLSTALMATAILVVAGTLAGLMPAIKAVRINPITALRSE